MTLPDHDERALKEIIRNLNDRIIAYGNAACALIDDVKRRYPGEELKCPHMIALDKVCNGEPYVCPHVRQAHNHGDKLQCQDCGANL